MAKSKKRIVKTIWPHTTIDMIQKGNFRVQWLERQQCWSIQLHKEVLLLQTSQPFNRGKKEDAPELWVQDETLGPIYQKKLYMG
jgi:hypothetical protein